MNDMNQGGCCSPKNSCSTDAKTECGPKDCGPGSCGTSKCCGTLLKGAIFGGILFFAVYCLSWMVLPFHMDNIKGFSNEAVIAKAIDAGAETSGIYFLPLVKDAATKPAVEKPAAFVNVIKEGVPFDGNMNKQFICFGILSLLIAGILTCILKKASGCPLRTSLKVGLLAALVSEGPNLIWMHFPLNNALINAADIIVATMVAGLVIAKFVIKKPLGCN